MTEALRIAVADDEPIMRMYLESVLPDLGHEVVASAEDGSELVQACRSRTPDLIISDIRMPRLDGIQALREIWRDVPVPAVFVTGFDEEQRLKEAEKYCVLVYLTKPVDETHLGKAIGVIMERWREFEYLRGEAEDLDEALALCRTVQRAKAVLARREPLGEAEACERLRARAEAERRTVGEVARELVIGD
jgi:AmiR/NasT family two-component response regulator